MIVPFLRARGSGNLIIVIVAFAYLVSAGSPTIPSTCISPFAHYPIYYLRLSMPATTSVDAAPAATSVFVFG